MKTKITELQRSLVFSQDTNDEMTSENRKFGSENKEDSKRIVELMIVMKHLELKSLNSKDASTMKKTTAVGTF